MNSDDTYRDICEIIVAADGTPIPTTDTLISIIKKIVAEDELELVQTFRERKSQPLEQLVETSGKPEEKIEAGAF